MKKFKVYVVLFSIALCTLSCSSSEKQTQKPVKEESKWKPSSSEINRAGTNYRSSLELYSSALLYINREFYGSAEPVLEMALSDIELAIEIYIDLQPPNPYSLSSGKRVIYNMIDSKFDRCLSHRRKIQSKLRMVRRKQ